MSRPITEAYQGSDTQGPLRGWSNRGKATGAVPRSPALRFQVALAALAAPDASRDESDGAQRDPSVLAGTTRGARERSQTPFGKNRAISRAADSGPSLP